MSWLMDGLQFFLHIDQHLLQLINDYGAWTYGILFLIIFCETGLVVTPILPGDSLLFAAGTLAAQGSLSLPILLVLLFIAAVLGDSLNYWVGHRFGNYFSAGSGNRLVKAKHLQQTHEFFEKYGGKTIVIARFMPIVRTFAPFVAGIGCMRYATFFLYNVLGAGLWIGLLLGTSFYFGSLPVVKNNFSLVILAIIVLSVLPALLEWLRSKAGRV